MKHPEPINPAIETAVLCQLCAEAHSQGEVGTEGCCFQMATCPHIPHTSLDTEGEKINESQSRGQ